MRLSDDKPTTHCTIPGHGTRCVVAHEKDGRVYPRPTKERKALDFEEEAEEHD